MSALCQQRTLAPLLDHLVSGHLQRQGQVQAECLGGFEIDDEFEFRRLLHRQVRWLLTPENAVHVRGRPFEWVYAINPISDQTAILGKGKLGSDNIVSPATMSAV